MLDKIMRAIGWILAILLSPFFILPAVGPVIVAGVIVLGIALLLIVGSWQIFNELIQWLDSLFL